MEKKKSKQLIKKIHYNHSKKMWLLNIRFRKIRKKKNKSRLGKSKQQIADERVYESFRNYTKVKAPRNFSLITNTEESLAFISKLEKCLVVKKKTFVNLANTIEIAHGAIVVLLSIMIKFKSRHIDFNGNFPKNKHAKKCLLDSGFFKELYKKNILLTDTYAVCHNKILTHANKVVDAKLTDQIISDVSTLIWGERKRCLGVQRVFIELMQNTNNHASISHKGDHHWWTTVQFDRVRKKAYFSFIDYGVGIIDSLNGDSGGRFFNIIPKIKELFNPHSNADMLRLLLNGEIHKTSTGKTFRGKGLPCLFKACDENNISNVVVIANDAKVTYFENHAEKLNNSFHGTFIYWEINERSKHITY